MIGSFGPKLEPYEKKVIVRLNLWILQLKRLRKIININKILLC